MKSREEKEELSGKEHVVQSRNANECENSRKWNIFLSLKHSQQKQTSRAKHYVFPELFLMIFFFISILFGLPHPWKAQQNCLVSCVPMFVRPLCHGIPTKRTRQLDSPLFNVTFSHIISACISHSEFSTLRVLRVMSTHLHYFVFHGNFEAFSLLRIHWFRPSRKRERNRENSQFLEILVCNFDIRLRPSKAMKKFYIHFLSQDSKKNSFTSVRIIVWQ